MSDAAVVGDLPARRVQAPLDLGALPARPPGADGLDEAGLEGTEPGEIGLVGEPEELGELLELVPDLGAEARVQEDDLLGRLPEELLGLLSVGTAHSVDVPLPILEPARQDEEGLFLEEVVEDVLVDEPFGALALLRRRAGAVGAQAVGGLGQAEAADETGRPAFPPERRDGFGQAFPAALDEVALDFEGRELDIFEFGQGGQGADFALQVRAHDQAELAGHRFIRSGTESRSNSKDMSIIRTY